MTNISVTIPASGVASLVSNALPTDSLIYNTDTQHGVWVSSEPGMTYGVGVYLGPKGVTTWKGGPTYAVVDSGVTSPVSIVATDEATAIDNPVDQAQAIALAGVPNVFTESTLYNSVLAGTAYYSCDVHTYSSLLIDVARPDNNAIELQVMVYPLPNQQGTGRAVFLTVPSDPNNGKSRGSWQVPVTGASITVTNLDNNPTGPAVTIIGTNQPAPSKVLNLGPNNLPRYFSYTGATTANTLVQLTGHDGATTGNSLNNTTICNGPFDLITSDPANGSVGFWVMRYLGVDGNHDIYVPVQQSGNRAQYTLNHPSVPCLWFFYPTTTVASVLTYELWMVPS